MSDQMFNSNSKYKNIFFFDGDNKYLEKIRSHNRNINLIRYENSLSNFFSKENKQNIKEYIRSIELDKKDAKELDFPVNKIYIVEIWEDLNSAISSVEQIPNIDKYYSKINKYTKKHRNLFFVVLNKSKVLEKLESEKEEMMINEEKINEQVTKKVNEIVQEKERELKFKIQEELNAQKEILDAERQVLETQRLQIEDERHKLEEQEKKLQQESENIKIKEEIKEISKSKKENIVEYTFDDYDNSYSRPKTADNGNDYDNIVWLNNENKDLFKVKKSNTKYFDLDEVDDPSFGKLIKENSDIEAIRLETNQVKIDFDEQEDQSNKKEKKTYIPYDRI